MQNEYQAPLEGRTIKVKVGLRNKSFTLLEVQLKNTQDVYEYFKTSLFIKLMG